MRSPFPSDKSRFPQTKEDADMLASLQWNGLFSVHDPDPADDHSAIYLVCPNGLMVNFSSDPTPGLDASRVSWIADTLNAAPGPVLPSEIESYDDLLDAIESAIDESMDYDWRYRDGAKSVAKALVGANAVRFAGQADTLDALTTAERFLDYFVNERRDFTGPGTPQSALDQVRAAIAKASGKAA